MLHRLLLKRCFSAATRLDELHTQLKEATNVLDLEKVQKLTVEIQHLLAAPAARLNCMNGYNISMDRWWLSREIDAQRRTFHERQQDEARCFEVLWSHQRRCWCHSSTRIKSRRWTINALSDQELVFIRVLLSIGKILEHRSCSSTISKQSRNICGGWAEDGQISGNKELSRKYSSWPGRERSDQTMPNLPVQASPNKRCHLLSCLPRRRKFTTNASPRQGEPVVSRLQNRRVRLCQPWSKCSISANLKVSILASTTKHHHQTLPPNTRGLHNPNGVLNGWVQ